MRTFPRADAAPGHTSAVQSAPAASAEPKHAMDARRLLHGAQRFDPNNPVARHLARVKRELASKGLPASAEGVRVFITGESLDREHGRKVAQLISGPDGLARGCSLGVIDWEENSTFAESFEKDLARRYHGLVRTALAPGTCPLVAVGDIGVVGLTAALARRRQEIQAVREKVEHLDGTTLVSQSWARGIAVEATSLARRFLENGGRGPLRQEIEAELGRPLAPHMEDLAAVRDIFAQYIDVALSCDEGDAAKEYARYKSLLEAEVELASALGILVFVAAGNDQANAWLPEHAVDASAGTGVIAVAAADIGDPDQPHDDGVARFSAPGNFAAPGVRIPTANGDVNGTSYSAPLAAATAALMVAANPALTPGDIVDILRAPGSARDLPGDRDGAGLIDVVAVVQVAARRRNDDHLGVMSLREAQFGPAKRG